MHESRLAQILIKRNGILSWLQTTAHYPVRAVCGPRGSGKTTALRQYAALSAAGTVAHVQVRDGTTADELAALVACTGTAEEIVLDDLDRATPTAVEMFFESIAHGDSRRFVILGRSRALLRAQSLVARGSAALIDPHALTFDDEEIAQLSSALGIAHDAGDIAQLRHDTDGWAVAVDWILRDAARAGRPLRGAFEEWIERSGHLLLEFVGSSVEAMAEFESCIRGGWMNAQNKLDRLESLGYPIVRARSLLRPCRILITLLAPAPSVAEEVQHDPLLSLKLLGRFRCEIGARTVAFQRRRDRNIFAFVAMAPEGRVQRQQILEAFWPDVNRALATQGLRTALSRIRHALGQAVGAEAVDSYFNSEKLEIGVDQSKVVVDARRFIDQVERGRMEEACGTMPTAMHHYHAAERLYENRLFASEAVEQCFVAQVEELEQMYATMLLRLAELSARNAEYDNARNYARRLIARSSDEDMQSRVFTFLGPRERVPA